MESKVATLSLQKSRSTIISSSRFKTRNEAPFKRTQTTMQESKKLIISKVIKELTTDKEAKGDIKRVLERPHIQQMLKEEFQLSDSEIKELQTLIVAQCSNIISRQASEPQFKRSDTSSTILKRPASASRNQAKQQPLTMLQRKELERQQTMDYFQFPVQPCVRSLYYLSKIAQTQSLKIMVPPTVLLGFGDDNRIIYNDLHTGKLVVEYSNISPKRISNFISSHMVRDHPSYSIEEQLLFPRFVIKLATKTHTQNDIKLYYSRESLIADMLNFWGSFDLAVQGFVKQKHPMRPSIYRCHVNKGGNVYKAMAINNQENINKESKIYRQLLSMIEQNTQRVMSHQRPDREPNRFLESTGFARQSTLMNSFERYFKAQTLSPSKSKRVDTSQANLDQSRDGLDKEGFPKSLEHFNTNDYYNELQRSIPNYDLKRAFICTADNIDILTMMNCRPSALQQAANMTTDLFRLFSQYYLKIQRFGYISQFVCDFIEDHHGIMYLLQVKSFECEGVLHEWQRPFQPTKSIPMAEQVKEATEIQERKCEVAILCKQSQLSQWFEQACHELDLWNNPEGKRGSQSVPEKIVRKYKAELEIAKECFCLMSEKQKVCALFPLASFCDNNKHFLLTGVMPEPVKIVRQQSILTTSDRKSSIASFQQPQPDRGNNSPQRLQSPDPALLRQRQNTFQSSDTIDEEPKSLDACQICHKVIDLFSQRYYALVFKTENTMEELRKLKLRLVNRWTSENVLFLLKIYKDSKKSLNIVSDADFIQRRVLQKAIRERAKSPDSVMRKSIKNLRRPASSYRQDTLGTSRLTLTNTHFDQIIDIESKQTLSHRKMSSARKLQNSRSLLRSVDRFHQYVESIGGLPYDQSKLEEVMSQSHSRMKKRLSLVTHSKQRPRSGAQRKKTTFEDEKSTDFQSALKITEGGGLPYADAETFNRKCEVLYTDRPSTGEVCLREVELKSIQERGIPAKAKRVFSGNVKSLLQAMTKSKHSDKEMVEYFNNKRHLSKLMQQQ